MSLINDTESFHSLALKLLLVVATLEGPDLSPGLWLFLYIQLQCLLTRSNRKIQPWWRGSHDQRDLMYIWIPHVPGSTSWQTPVRRGDRTGSFQRPNWTRNRWRERAACSRISAPSLLMPLWSVICHGKQGDGKGNVSVSLQLMTHGWSRLRQWSSRKTEPHSPKKQGYPWNTLPHSSYRICISSLLLF